MRSPPRAGGQSHDAIFSKASQPALCVARTRAAVCCKPVAAFRKKPSSFSGSSQIRGGIPAMANFTHSRHPESNEGVFVREGFPNKPSCRHIIRTSTDLWLTGCRIQQRLTCYRGLGDSQIQIRRQSRISIKLINHHGESRRDRGAKRRER